MTYEFLTGLYEDLMNIIRGLVVKRYDLAYEAETLDTARAFEVYLSCVNGTSYFYTFATYDVDVLISCGIDPSMAEAYAVNPNNIPEEYRDRVVAKQTEYVIANYEEKNEYYRMLLGLPPLKAGTKYIYPLNADGSYYLVDDEGNPVPIHKFTPAQISRLETFGVLDQIKAQYPDVEYLNYLGSNAIDLVQARLARPFDLLRIGDPSNPRTIDLFQREYHFARRYVMANYYNRQQVATKTLYDPTIGVIILTLTVRNVFALDENSYLNFDEILNLILESYGLLKYFKRFPFTYKRRLVIAMDALLEHKGTDGVLVDVCKLFSPNQDLVANRYYLMKTQKRDDTGLVIESADPDEAYDLTFLKAQIDERDINTNEEHRVDYSSVTKNDYLWQIEKYEEDGVTITDAYRKLLEDPYNLRMTKYIDAQAAYDITSLTFEVCCFLNMLLHSRDKLSKLILANRYATGTNINLETRTANGSSSLYVMVLFLLTTLSARAGFDGNIVYDPETISEVWGESVNYSHIWHFNYDDQIEMVQKAIDEYGLNIDIADSLLSGTSFELEDTPGSPSNIQLLKTYLDNRALFEAIQSRMNSTHDIREYQALHNIRDILFTRYAEEEMFTRADGSLARTYRELLDDFDPRLGQKIDAALDDVDALNGMAVYILEQLQDYFRSDDLQYLFLNTPSVYIELVRDYIEIALNVFKASSVQLRNINVMFYYGDGDPVRVFDVGVTKFNLHLNDEVHVQEEIGINYHLILEDYVAVGDNIYYNQ